LFAMYHHRTLLSALAASLLIPLALAGCQSGNVTGPMNPNQSNGSGNGLPKSVIVTVHDEAEQPTGTKIFVSIAVDSGGIPIALPTRDTLYCDGAPLFYDDAASVYKGAMTQVATDGRYSFSLRDSAGIHYLCDVPVHARPQISNPSSGSAVARSGQFRIMYAAEAGTIGIASTIRGNPITITPQTFEPDNGSSAMYDLTTLPTGPGWVQIVRHYQASHADLGFKSIEANFYVGKVSGVTWQ
jgi:hypothetical protein